MRKILGYISTFAKNKRRKTIHVSSDCTCDTSMIFGTDGGKLTIQFTVGDGEARLYIDPSEIHHHVLNALDEKRELWREFDAQQDADGIHPMKQFGAIPYHSSLQRNLLTGKLYMERCGTPSYCSPSSEAYHSM